MNQESKNKREIALNFLSLNKSDFEFMVSRRSSLVAEKKFSEEIRQHKLPDESGEYKHYWVSFNEFKDANKLPVSSLTNIYLTKYYLFTLLKQNLDRARVKYIQKENEKRFAPNHLYIIAETTKWGDKTIRIEPYYLKIKKLFGFLIDYKFLKNKDDKDVNFSHEIQKLSFSLDDEYRSNKSYHIDKYRYIQDFLRKDLHKLSKIRDDLEILNEFVTLESSQLNLREYIFGNEGRDKSQFQGINQYGPLEKVKENIKYYYVFHKDHKDYANVLIKALNGESFKTFEGLARFSLPNQTKDNTRGITIESFNYNLENYISSEINENCMLIAIFPSKEEKFYFTLKNICLQKNVPLQTVHLETIIDGNKLKWSLSGIALQMLAKLGGVPWIVEAENTNCLIIGIGQSIERDNKNKPIRFFAYSVLLDSSGKFLTIEPIAEATEKSEYLKKISEKIPEIINGYPDYKKIVFHIPEKVSFDTIKKIEDTLNKIGKNIKLYIIRVNDDSKFFGYALNNNSLIPYESSYIQLSKKEFLLWTEGLNYRNPTPRKRYSNPIYVDFYYSNQSIIYYSAFLQDILNLSGTNYRGFNAKALPVSMFYPKLISIFYKHFNKYELPTLTAKKEKMWFL